MHFKQYIHDPNVWDTPSPLPPRPFFGAVEARPFTNKLPICELQRRTLTVLYKDTRRRNSRHETFPLLSHIVRLIACGTAYCFVYSVHLFFRVYSCLFACFRYPHMHIPLSAIHEQNLGIDNQCCC